MSKSSQYKLQVHAGSQYVSIELKGKYGPGNIKAAEEIIALRKMAPIIAYEQNAAFQLSSIPNDPGLSNQWALNNQGQRGGNIGADIEAFAAWSIQSEGAGILGLIDTGVDYTHPDLVENIWQNLAEDADGDGRVLEQINGIWQLDPGDLDGIDADNNGYIDDLVGWDFVENDNNPFDDNGHGTHVAGIMGAKGNNNIGISGIAWSTQIMALKAFDRHGTGQLSNILPALEYARNMGVLLSNNSWGSIHYSTFLLEEILEAEKEGQIFVAAAGNNGRFDPSAPVYPAAYPLQNIISVAASDDRDRLAGFSSFHPEWVDLSAPGQYIYSTLPAGSYGFKSGTSMAAPMLAGALSLLHAQRPDLGPAEMKSLLLAQVDLHPDLFGSSQSNGRINVYKLLSSQSSSTLRAHFTAPKEACIQSEIEFRNTSILPNPDQGSYRWEVNGQFVANTSHLDYMFEEVGWYEVKLFLSEGGSTDEYMSPIHIKEKAQANLGNDTSICASTYVLFANSTDHKISWKRYCPPPGNCYSMKQDSIRLEVRGGDLMELDEQAYILTNASDEIVEISSTPIFSADHPLGSYQIHGIYFESAQPPTGLRLGELKSSLDFGLGNCHIFSESVEIALSQVEKLGDKPMLRVKESGSYILELEDACGNLSSDTLTLTLTGECVWPGDVNADGLVSVWDFLALGIANGSSGIPRTNPSTRWEAQSASDWNQNFSSDNLLAPDINFKHADPNGDGIIDLNQDKQVLNQHLGFSYEIDSLSHHAGLSFYLQHEQTTFFGDGDTAAIEISMYLSGEGDKEVQDFYGAAFSLNFSDPISRMPSLDFSTSWLGPMEQIGVFTDGSRRAFGSQFLPRDRKSLSFGLVSANRLSSRGRGRIAGTIIIVVADDIVDDSLSSGISSFSVNADQIFVIDRDGKVLSSISASSLSGLDMQINWEEANRQENESAPFKWVDVQLTHQASHVKINWTVENEVDIMHYVLERSLDGSSFRPIKELAAKALFKGKSQYQVLDKDILNLPRQQLYYRIKRMEKNGAFFYSNIRKVELQSSMGAPFLSAHPNPFSSELSIEYRLSQLDDAALTILNTLGQEIWTTQVKKKQDSFPLKTQSWPKGIYFIKLQTEEKSYIHKLIK
ncbi:MAG: S8 family serine peptidase [Bacteroidota bacterium]